MYEVHIPFVTANAQTASSKIKVAKLKDAC